VTTQAPMQRTAPYPAPMAAKVLKTSHVNTKADRYSAEATPSSHHDSALFHHTHTSAGAHANATQRDGGNHHTLANKKHGAQSSTRLHLNAKDRPLRQVCVTSAMKPTVRPRATPAVTHRCRIRDASCAARFSSNHALISAVRANSSWVGDGIESAGSPVAAHARPAPHTEAMKAKTMARCFMKKVQGQWAARILEHHPSQHNH